MSLTINIRRLTLQLPPPGLATLTDLGSTDLPLARLDATSLDLFAKPKAIRVAGDGAHLPSGDTTTPHVAVLFPDYGVMVSPNSLGDDDLTQQEAVKAARLVNVLGHKDWGLACRTIWERLVLDTTRIDLAVDPFLFPGIKPGWHWTSTLRAQRANEAAGDPAYAWLVNTDLGSVINLRYGSGFGLAARFVGQ